MALKVFRALSLICTMIILRSCLCQQQEEECIRGPSHLYTGTHSTTKSGITCQRWDTAEPHEVKKPPEGDCGNNYCRNPDRDISGTWCYTSDPAVRWEYCEIPKCNESVFVMWTSFNTQDDSACLDKERADPEFTSQRGLNVSDEFQKPVYENSELKVLAAGRNGEEIFFTDIKKDLCGVLNQKTLEIEFISEGSAKTIYAMAQDWVTANFYWTDTKMKWVYVSDRQFRAMLPIYKTAPAEPRAIAVQPEKRWVVFSTFLKLNTQLRDTQIIITDLAGKNPRVLFKYPDVVDVTGLAVDDERIYWTDYHGHESKVMSSSFDGSGKTEYFKKRFASFRDIAVYANYIYVTDGTKRYNYFDHVRYHIDVVRMDSASVYTFTKPGVPHGITILRTVKDDELPSPINGQRSCLKMCGGVCLPDDTMDHKCHCPFGYNIQQRTGACLPRLIRNNYLLALDKVGGKLYQISLPFGRNYSIAPFQNIGMINAAITDVATGTVYLYDKSAKEIRKGSLNGATKVIHAPTDTGLKHMAIDPITKNIYYVDQNNNINVVSGIFRDIIVENTDPSSDVKMIALDYQQKFVYWTDTSSQDGSGKVMRCRFDGKQMKTVLDNLQSPHGIAIDMATRKLFVLDAKAATIHELLLDKLKNRKSVLRQNHKMYELHQQLASRRLRLTEIALHGVYIYIADEESQQLVRYRYKFPNKRSGELSVFGPSIFYRMGSLSVYSSNLYIRHIASQPDPCKKKRCRTICTAVSQKKAICQ